MSLVAAVVLLATSALAQHASSAAPRVRHKVDPEYTDEARNQHSQGTVVLYTKIGTDGRARDIKVIRPLGHGLDEKAVECLAKWEFEPGMRDGVPVETPASVEINFLLEQ
ncbi:MAG TPA: energy transducer TonB [Bryobacteraceae bacterium]|nr:energy transducer TonB [Bryobacteraceae bacterium]